MKIHAVFGAALLAAALGGGCDNADVCVTTGDCATGVCVSGRCAAPCESNLDCSSGRVCRLGGCVERDAMDSGSLADAGRDAGVDMDSGEGADSGQGTDSGQGADSGSSDSGSETDGGESDSGRADAGPPDAGAPDAGAPDAGPPDAGPPDAGRPCNTATQHQDCERDEECHPSRLVCVPSRACAGGCRPFYICEGGPNRTCIRPGTARFNEPCSSNLDCQSGACERGFCGEPCFEDADCPNGHVCGLVNFGAGCVPCPPCPGNAVPLHDPPTVECSCFLLTSCDDDHPCPPGSGDCQRTSSGNNCILPEGECDPDELRVGFGGGAYSCGEYLGCYPDDPNACSSPYNCTTLGTGQHFCLR